MVEDIASTPRIYAPLDGRQAYHQDTMVKIEGNISNTSILILIDLGACWSYVSPKIVESCKIDNVKHEKPWMVQLAMSTKWKVYEIVIYYEVNLNGFPTRINLNILLLQFYDVLIGMELFEQHHVMIDCINNSILCTDSQGNQKKIQGTPKKVFIRQIYSLQVKKCITEGCKLFIVNIQYVEYEIEKHIEEFPILVGFINVCPKEITGLPMKRDLYFSI